MKIEKMRSLVLLKAGPLILVALLLAAPSAHAEPPPNLATMQYFLDIMHGYYGIIESNYLVNSNPEMAAILQMQKIQEVYESRGEKAKAVDVLRRVLDETENQTIRNAAVLLMSDNLKDTGRTAEALDLLQKGLSENLRAAG